jgi:hypothetical protein
LRAPADIATLDMSQGYQNYHRFATEQSGIKRGLTHVQSDFYECVNFSWFLKFPGQESLRQHDGHRYGGLER